MSSPAVQLRSRVPRLAEAAVERARLTVVPRRRTRAPRMPFVVLVSLVLLGGVVGLLLFNTSMQQASFAATALEQQASTLSAREQTLEMELDVLRDPQHVAEEAQAMGMVPARNPAFLSLSDGTVLGEPAPAAPTDGLRIRPRPPVKPAVLNPAPIIETVVVQTVPQQNASASSVVPGAAGGTDGDRRRNNDRSARR
ncbi:hypothetical protein ACFP3Q_00725 [Nocardioides sp. GCM10027113]|uniref:hypothetical protein n=1 Tax=unclassified Nocardioides TaxID=2615069 RepID=UPI00360A3048